MSRKQSQAQDFEISMPELKNETKRATNLEEITVGIPTIKELMLPASFGLGHASYLKAGEKYVRCFFVTGLPSMIEVGIFKDIYDSNEYDIDTSIRIEPIDSTAATNQLQRRLTDDMAFYMDQQIRGHISHQQETADKIDSLKKSIALINHDSSHFYQVQFVFNLYADSLEELNRKSRQLTQILEGKSIHIQPSNYRQDEGYKTVLPLGTAYIFDKYRNLDTSAVSALFPFYNAEVIQENGIFLGYNLLTNSPTIVDFYNLDKNIATGYNIFVVGKTGFGKSTFLSVLTARSSLLGIRTAMIDPEGEYSNLVKSLGGKEIVLSTSSKQMINMFDVEESYSYNEYGEAVRTFNLNEKVSDLLGLIGVMMHGSMTAAQQSAVSTALQVLYRERGFINGDPESIYLEAKYYDKEEDEDILNISRPRKKMPIFTDFMRVCSKLYEERKRFQSFEALKDVINALRPYEAKGINGSFDTQTSPDLQNLKDTPLIVFNVAGLEDAGLKPVGMYLALTWIWEKFAKKNPDIKKRVICDEAWMMLNDMDNNEDNINYPADFLRTLARRARKYNTSLVTASQQLSEFINSKAGQDVIQQSTYQIFLRLNTGDRNTLAQNFQLSDGEIANILQAQKGQILLKVGPISCITTVKIFPPEFSMLPNNIKK